MREYGKRGMVKSQNLLRVTKDRKMWRAYDARTKQRGLVKN